MANSRCALKRVRITAKKTARNKILRSKVKNSIRRHKLAILNESEDVDTTYKQAMSQIDRAVSKGIMHRNTAARKKSRLTKAYNKVSV